MPGFFSLPFLVAGLLPVTVFNELARGGVGAMPHGSCAVGDVSYEHGTSRCCRRYCDRNPDMNWKALDFEQITARELYLILRARSAVFVVEQSCVHLDPDGRDETSVHVFAVEDISRSMPVIAYARLHAGGAAAEVVVDKILTSPLRRCDGTAHALIERVIAAAGERWPGRSVRLLAPLDLRGFYEAFGFRKNEGPFDERGVRTIGMVRKSRLSMCLGAYVERTYRMDAGCIDTVEEI